MVAPLPDAANLLRMASAQRMNTDVRRAVFVAVMGSADCVEALEKLLRLPLRGEQEREVSRVLVDCCLQEKAWNPYYGLLAAKLCGASKNHKTSLQFCLWDHIKEAEDASVRRCAPCRSLVAPRLLLALCLRPCFVSR